MPKEAGVCERPGKGRPNTEGVGPVPSLRQTSPPPQPRPPRLSHPPPPHNRHLRSAWAESTHRRASPCRPSLSLCSPYPSPQVRGQPHTSRRQRRSRPLKPQRRYGHPPPPQTPARSTEDDVTFCHTRGAPGLGGAAALDPGRRFSVL